MKIHRFRNFRLIALLFGTILVTSCSKDDDVPEEENELEVITDVTLVFTNTADANDVVEATAQDPDGIGIQELVILNEIDLDAGKTYTLTFEIFNNLETPGEDIGDEILEEANEHQFFFGFSDDAFTNPAGNGNIDTASDPISYNDKDENGNPVGLSTTWTTAVTALSGGTFTVRLKHQPDVKTSTSGANDGETDFNLLFSLNIQ
jgi:hypothetical protein